MNKADIVLGNERIDEFRDFFTNKRVGLITNATGTDKKYKSTVDILKEKTNLTAIFTPEHGFGGNVQAAEKTKDEYDTHYNLPIYSLYGATRKPTQQMLDNIDVLVFDIQDVGTRHYTYVSTLVYAMQACKEQNKKVVVLDRPNPISGIVSGTVLKRENSSFIGLYPIPLRHGMTIGELAIFFNNEEKIGADLKVIPMIGWKRDMFITDTNIPWIQTSPNIPTPMSALLYNATGIVGSVQASDGIGTTQPFEFVGMPNIDAYELANSMNKYNFAGVHFRPLTFTPKFGNFKNITCNGVQLHITDYKYFDATTVGAVLIRELWKRYKGTDDFWRDMGEKKSIDLHLGEDSLQDQTQEIFDITKRWEQEANNFKKTASKYYLYK